MPIAHVGNRILFIRAQRVMLDADLAELYGVPTKRLNEQVKRNQNRFPEDFMFRLTRAEVEALNRPQIATGSQKHRDPRFPPFAFTEHGAIQAANVLNSPRAAEMGVHVVRAFVRMREVLATHKELARKLAALEQRIDSQDETIVEILAAIRQLMAPPEPKKKRPIGFVTPEEK
ncbi:MAG: ORF6N domain-containing protein [Betaproteobacteria bacterium]|nr:ORF6N domain-containing protein [Betaproteobacteria bacterium]MBI2293145.1 ORF6N domain-containing protein [Betaproteobacteria bacterium]MBI3055399.1 ORF6N domain-containing protein [Betaproteobacteria bacterium]